MSGENLSLSAGDNPGDECDSSAFLYGRPLPSSRIGPLYNAFSYPTKINPEAIALFIATHTKPGAEVLDIFAGSGTTGLAAMLCDKPTPKMKQVAKEMGVNPRWGLRCATLYELSGLGAFVSRTMCIHPDPIEFERAALELVASAEEETGWLYETLDPFGKAGRLRYAIWSDVLLCPNCKAEVPYWSAVVRRGPLHIDKEFDCPSCKSRVVVDKCNRAVETAFDRLLGIPVERKKRVLARTYGVTSGTRWQRDPINQDRQTLERSESVPVPNCAPIFKIEWGDLHRAGYHRGITHVHHFYTSRNFLAMATLWEKISSFKPELQDALRLLVLSYNHTHATLMTRVVVKNGQTDFVLTGAQSGVLYVSGLPVEKNVFEGVRHKVAILKKAFEVVAGSRSRVRVVNASSAKLQIPDEWIDYVFTDPPFGAYIPYAEVNQINEAWLGAVTTRKDEIVISEAQGKDVDVYATMMTEVFREIARVLKKDGRATIVFHSAKASVWSALVKAYVSAGLRVTATGVLDKLQTSFKQGVSDVVVKGDPFLLMVKAAPNRTTEDHRKPADDVVVEVIQRASVCGDWRELERERLYSRYVGRCLELGMDVSISAHEFYDRAEAWGSST